MLRMKKVKELGGSLIRSYCTGSRAFFSGNTGEHISATSSNDCMQGQGVVGCAEGYCCWGGGGVCYVASGPTVAGRDLLLREGSIVAGYFRFY